MISGLVWTCTIVHAQQRKAPLLAHKRSFGTIRRLPSGRYQAMFTTPTGARTPAPSTFAARIDAEGWLHQRRLDVEAGCWRPVRKPAPTSIGEYAATWRLASQRCA